MSEPKLTEAESAWITRVWGCVRPGRLAEVKGELEAILRDRLAPVEAERDEARRLLTLDRCCGHARCPGGSLCCCADDPAEVAALRQQVADLTTQRDVLGEAEGRWADRTEAAERALAARDEVIARVRVLADDASVIGGLVKPSALIATLDDDEPATDAARPSVATREYGACACGPLADWDGHTCSTSYPTPPTTDAEEATEA